MSTNTNFRAILEDPNVFTVPASKAAEMIGFSRSKAIRTYKATGELCDGVPIFRAGRDVLVATADLRRLFRIDDPTPKQGENQ